MTAASALQPAAHAARGGKAGARTVAAVHGLRETAPDPQFALDIAASLRQELDPERLLAAFRQHVQGSGPLDVRMRRLCLRALARRLGSGVTVRDGVSFIHPETMEIGDGVFFGEHAVIQGRFDGRCVIGAGTWIGPQSYLDARDLVIGENVGWGPGAKVLGSEHTAAPL